MFCVLGLPWQAAMKAYFEEENNVEALNGRRRFKE
jgi:hypothetical protein